MKPERSELLRAEDKDQRTEPFFRRLIRLVVGKLVNFFTRLWAPKVDGQK